MVCTQAIDIQFTQIYKSPYLGAFYLLKHSTVITAGQSSVYRTTVLFH
ncbi:hypothetical protein MGSAQ_001204 [marine sediment metagenome]|uniref:Uncharacterized protein n=1 Tax=marine sediment metagenome TaxID=412755 RepID=A0A1B6NVF0_9ZZZZ